MIDERYRDLSVEDLRQRLFEAEETLRAIRDGEADAVVMRGGSDDRVHALGSEDESYRVIMEAMDIGAVALDARNAVVYANSAMCDLLDCSFEQMQQTGLTSCFSPEVAELVQTIIDQHDGQRHTGQFAQAMPMGTRHIIVAVSPLPLAFGMGLVLTFTDVTARLADERASESARIARAVISSANEAVVVCDVHGKVVNANATAIELTGGDPLHRAFEEAYPLSFSVSSPIIHAEDLVTMAVEGNSIQGLEAKSARGGTCKDLLVSAAPLRLAAHQIGGCVITLVDNTDRKAIENHQSLLLRELDHRVKNTLAMVMSIASRTSASAADLPDFRSRFNSRLQALAATHILLAESEWSGLMLSSVVNRELAPYTTSAGPKLVVEGLDRKVSSDIGIAFALVVHELTTNAVKYGALSQESGVITIAGEDAGNGMVKVRWIESGGPAVEPPTRSGFGQTLISRSLNRGNGGGATVDFKPSGLVCEMRLPLR